MKFSAFAQVTAQGRPGDGNLIGCKPASKLCQLCVWVIFQQESRKEKIIPCCFPQPCPLHCKGWRAQERLLWACLTPWCTCFFFSTAIMTLSHYLLSLAFKTGVSQNLCWFRSFTLATTCVLQSPSELTCLSHSQGNGLKPCVLQKNYTSACIKHSVISKTKPK